MDEVDPTTPSKYYWQYPSYKDKIRKLGVPVQQTWRINYVASSGESTFRTVTISHVLSDARGVHILGHCQLRNEERAFKVSRIMHAFDLSTYKRIESPLDAVEQIIESHKLAAKQKQMEGLAELGLKISELLKTTAKPKPKTTTPHKSTKKR